FLSSVVKLICAGGHGCYRRHDAVLIHLLQRNLFGPCLAADFARSRDPVMMNIDAAVARRSSATPATTLLRDDGAGGHCFYEFASVGHALNLGKRRSALPRSMA